MNCSVVSDFLQSHGLQPARLLCPWDSLGKSTGVDCQVLPGDRPNPGIEPMSLMFPALAGRFFTTSAAYIYIHVYSQAESREMERLGGPLEN